MNQRKVSYSALPRHLTSSILAAISLAVTSVFLVKPLDSSLESENERYENGAPDGSENEEGDGGEYKKYNDFTENTDNFGKPSFTDFSRLESKLCEFEYARNESTDVKIENETPKSEKILTLLVEISTFKSFNEEKVEYV